MRWLYFDLLNREGAPDQTDIKDIEYSKYYRTNFWQVVVDPDDSSVFYLSHRGASDQGGSEYANSIVKATVFAEPRSSRAGEGEPRVVPLTKDFMRFERVYGFKGEERPDKAYVGPFAVSSFEGEKVIYVNHFRDPSNFKENYYYALTASTFPTESRRWFAEKKNNSNGFSNSYYEVAVGQDGKILTTSYFENELRLYQATFDNKDLAILKTIK